MTAKYLVRYLLVAMSLCLGMMARAAADPSVDQVYQAARSGHYDQAQSMMRQVLKDHPGSAKAHFVEAELLAGHGNLASARGELDKARSLDANLSFAKPEAVRSLENRLAAATPARSGRMSMWVWLIGALAIAALWLGVRSSMQRRAWGPGATGMGRPMGGPAGPVGPGAAPYGAGYGPGMPGAVGPSAGMGSGILGGLASGAAMGAGFAAGEALIDRALGNRQGSVAPGNFVTPPGAGSAVDPSAAGYDMGGNDFGLQDSSSWDSSSADAGGSADDWDTGAGGDSWDTPDDSSNDWS